MQTSTASLSQNCKQIPSDTQKSLNGTPDAQIEILARMDRLAASGRLCGCHDALVTDPRTGHGERFAVQVNSLRGELLLTFTSAERTDGPAQSETVNGRTVHAAGSHQRRILVNENGDLFLDAGKLLALTPRNKYEAVARSIVAAHLAGVKLSFGSSPRGGKAVN